MLLKRGCELVLPFVKRLLRRELERKAVDSLFQFIQYYR
jgi:hypothetical protein